MIANPNIALMKGKRTFTKSQANAIIALIKKKLFANKLEQKKIRDKIRTLGFYASDFGIGGGYTELDFLKVVKIIGDETLTISAAEQADPSIHRESKKKRSHSDETYILDLCDNVTKLKGHRQYRFDFLKGDSGVSLPVDIYYPSLKLVIEYRERQHTEEVKFFDRRKTVSGVNRGEQRKKYDQLRRDILPKNGIKIIEFGFDEFEHTNSKRLIRNKETDTDVIKKKIMEFNKK